MQLFPFQVEGANFLADRRRALLFDEPGLGKTPQALRAADIAGFDELDTICPAAVVGQWKKQAKKIAETDYTFKACSYNKARDHGMRPKLEGLALDESHFLKNRKSGRTEIILGDQAYGTNGLIIRADYVWCLCGTPMPKDPSELYPIMFAVVPGSLRTPGDRTMDYWAFMQRFCVMYDSGRGMAVREGKNLDELKDRLAPYMLRRKKKDVLKDWKEPVCAELWLDAGNALDLLLKAEKSPEGAEIAKALQRGGFDALAEIAETNHGIAKLRRFTGKIKVLPVVEWLGDEFDNGLDKIVLIAYHREVIEDLHAELKSQLGIESVKYMGGMTDTEKDAAKMRFIVDPKCRVFIGQLTAAGTGLDGLQHATGDMVFIEWSWVNDDNYQAISRLDRILDGTGKTRPVLARFAGLEGSLDGAIMERAAQRAADNVSLFG